MKKFAMLIIAVIVLCATYYKVDFVDFISEDATEVCFYTNDTFIKDNEKVISNGKINMVFTTPQKAKKVKDSLNSFIGISYTLNGTYEDMKQLVTKLKGKVVFSQEIEGITTIYAYNSHLKKSVNLRGEKVNIQFAFSQGNITVGYPLIIGSY